MSSRLLIALFLLLRATAADYFGCPPNAILVDILGNTGCSDYPPAQPNCQLLVSPQNSCIFSIYPSDNAINAAQLHISASGKKSGDSITITGRFDTITSDDDSTFDIRAAFPMSGDVSIPFLTINVTSRGESEMLFGYFIQNNYVPTFGSETKISTGAGQLAQFVQLQDAVVGDYWTVTGEQNVTLSGQVSRYTSPYDLLNIWYYEGSGDKMALLGSAYSPGYNYVPSSTKQITLHYVLQSADILDGTLVLNEYKNLASCAQYIVIWSPSPDELGLGFQRTPVCLTVLNSVSNPVPTFLHSISVQRTNSSQTMTTLLMAGGPVTDPAGMGTLLMTYSNLSDIVTPQRLTSFASTFVGTTDSPELSFVWSGQESDNVANIGRRGFLTTPMYPYTMPNQNVVFYVNGTDLFNFTFTIQNSLSPAGSLTIYGSSSRLYKITPKTGTTLSYVDTLIELDIEGGPAANGGVYLTYSISSTPTAVTTVGTSTRIVPNSVGTTPVTTTTRYGGGEPTTGQTTTPSDNGVKQRTGSLCITVSFLALYLRY